MPKLKREAKVLGRIYSGWKIVETVPHEARLIGYCLDFGYDPDPAAIVAVYWYKGGFILHEVLYQTELLNERLAAALKALPKAPIVADSAEPKSIAELQQHGLTVIPCERARTASISASSTCRACASATRAHRRTFTASTRTMRGR